MNRIFCFLCLVCFLSGCVPITPISSIPATSTPEFVTISIGECKRLIEPKPTWIEITVQPGSGAVLDAVKWTTDNGKFQNDTEFATSFYPGHPGQVNIYARVKLKSGASLDLQEQCFITGTEYTETPYPTSTYTPYITATFTDTPVPPTFTYTPPPTPEATLTPSPTNTVTLTPVPTTAPISVTDCVAKADWMVNPSISDQVIGIGDKCYDLSNLGMSVDNGIKIENNNESEIGYTYNLYSREKIYAPTVIKFRIEFYKTETIAKAWNDISVYAGFIPVDGDNPKWLQPQNNGEASGQFMIMRVSGATVHRLGKGGNNTKYFLFEDNIFGFNNVKEEFIGNNTEDHLGVDFEIHYLDNSTVVYWKPEGDGDYKDFSVPRDFNPSYFVIGYKISQSTNLKAYIRNLSIFSGNY